MLPFLRVPSLGRSGRHWASVERERKVGKGKGNNSKKLFKNNFRPNIFEKFLVIHKDAPHA